MKIGDMRIRTDPVKIDLESSSNLKDYYYLTLILGAGLLMSVVIFAAIVHLKYSAMHKEFAGQSEILASGLDLAFSNRIFRLESLESELQHSRFLKKEALPQINQILQSAKFDHLVLLRLDPATHEMTISWDYALDMNSKSPSIGDETMQAVRPAVQALSSINSNYAGLFLPREGRTKFAVIWKYMHSSRNYLIALGEAESLFQKEMEPGLRLFVEQPLYGRPEAFSVVGDGGDSIRLVPMSGEELRAREMESSLRTSKSIPALGGSMRFHILRNHDTLTVLAWPLFSVAACLAITCLIALLVFNLINRNIEVQKLVEQKTRDLEAESKKALEAADAKTRFLANVSHEVRTPLNLILGMADLLRETPLTEEQSRFVDNFSRAGNHLLRLIGDILDVAKLDADGIPVFPDKVPLLRFFEELTDFVSPSCQIKGLNLNLNIDPHLPSEATFDPARVRQIVLNLLNNSLKFTDSGSISLEVRHQVLSEVGAPRPGLSIKVSDTGIGIPNDQIKNVFTEFFQVDASATRSRGGAGLGLAIVRAIVDRLNGKVQVHSELNVGTEISVFLPVEFSDDSRIEDLIVWQRRPERVVLFYSDEKLSVQTFSWLTNLNIQVDSIPLAVSNLRAAREWLPECDFVFVELAPETQISWIRLLKENIAPDTRLVIITKGHLQTELARTLSESWNYSLLTVPALPSRLVAIMGGVIRSPSRPTVTRIAPEVPAAPINVPENFKVLIVEDDYDNRILIEAYMARLPYRFEFATNGKEALAAIAGERPSMIITDLQMPVMDGFTFIEKFRALERAEGRVPCPIVILTADAQEETVRKAKNFQVEKFLTKPVRKRDFIEVLNEFAHESQEEPSKSLEFSGFKSRSRPSDKLEV